MDEKKSEQVNIKLTPQQMATAQRLAKADRRKVGQYLGLIVSDYLESKKGA